MSISVIEDLVRVYRGSVPQDMVSDQIGVDIAYTLATIIAAAEEEVSRLAAGIILSTATGAFLDQHAKDRGLRRADGETDDQLRERLRFPPKAGTVSAIVESIQAIVGAGHVYVIELPRDSFYFDRYHFFDTHSRFNGPRSMVIVLIPASANALTSVTDALRSKVSGGKLWLVEEYA